MRKFLAIIVSFSIFFNVFSPVQYIVTGGKTLVTFLATIMLFLFCIRHFSSSIIKLLLYALIACYMMISGNGYFENYIPTLVYMSFSVFCYDYYYYTRDEFFSKCTLYTLYVSLFLMIAISIPQFYNTPGLVRLMNREDYDGMNTFYSYFIISYSTIHELCIYIIPLFALYRNARGILKYLDLILIAMFFVLMLFSDSTTSLIIMTLSLLLFLIYNPQKPRSVNVRNLIVVAIFALVFLNKNVMVDILQFVQPLFDGTSTFRKIDEIILLLNDSGTSGDLEVRENLYDITFNSLKNNLFFPQYDANKISHHMALVDHLAALGLFLFIPFVAVIFDRVKKPLKVLNDNNRYFFIFGVGVFCVMGCIKNFFLFCSAFCYVPMCLMLIGNKSNKIN